MEERFETFTVLIAKIARSIRKIKNQEMAEYGLKSHHVSCLYYLYTCEGLTAADLCTRCEEDKATISRSLDYLEENGFLAPRPKDVKNYKNPLALTKRGLEAGGTIAGKVDLVLDKVSTCLTESERAAFYRSLMLISESLDAMTAGIER